MTYKESELTISASTNGGSVLELRLVTDENHSTWSAARVFQDWAIQAVYAMADSEQAALYRLRNPHLACDDEEEDVD